MKDKIESRPICVAISTTMLQDIVDLNDQKFRLRESIRLVCENPTKVSRNKGSWNVYSVDLPENVYAVCDTLTESLIHIKSLMTGFYTDLKDTPEDGMAEPVRVFRDFLMRKLEPIPQTETQE